MKSNNSEINKIKETVHRFIRSFDQRNFEEIKEVLHNKVKMTFIDEYQEITKIRTLDSWNKFLESGIYPVVVISGEVEQVKQQQETAYVTVKMKREYPKLVDIHKEKLKLKKIKSKWYITSITDAWIAEETKNLHSDFSKTMNQKSEGCSGCEK